MALTLDAVRKALDGTGLTVISVEDLPNGRGRLRLSFAGTEEEGERVLAAMESAKAKFPDVEVSVREG